MSTTISYPNAPDLSADDYIIIGLATCFVKEDAEVHEVEIIEPITAASLEALFKGVPTSYKLAFATTLSDVIEDNIPKKPANFPPSAEIAEDFIERTVAAARTYKRNDSAKSLISPGTTHTNFEYSTERKRILNAARVVSKEDNVKQHSHTHKVL